MRRTRLFAIACVATVCSAATIEARRALYDEALAIIRREFADDLRLTEVARRIGASGRALQRAFAEHGELSFSEELRTTRLNVAARLLRGTRLPVRARRRGVRVHARILPGELRPG